VSDYLNLKNTNPKTIVKKEMVIEPGYMTMDKEEYKINKLKEASNNRLAYFKQMQKNAPVQKEHELLQSIDNDITTDDSSDSDDIDMNQLENTYESINNEINKLKQV